MPEIVAMGNQTIKMGKSKATPWRGPTLICWDRRAMPWHGPAIFV